MQLNLPETEILGVKIHPITLKHAVDIVSQAISSATTLQIGVVNSAKLVNMRRDDLLREDVLSSDLVLADGMAVVWATRILGQVIPERVPGIDLMTGILERGDRLNFRVYCLGADEAVSSEVEKQIRTRYPGVRLVGRRHGYFSQCEEEAIAREIAASGADVLFVGMSSPKKERFIAKWGDVLNVHVSHGVGGSFDVLAGKVRRAPATWQRVGLEWLYRLAQEPRRLWRRYLVTNSIFIGLVLKQLFLQWTQRNGD